VSEKVQPKARQAKRPARGEAEAAPVGEDAEQGGKAAYSRAFVSEAKRLAEAPGADLYRRFIAAEVATGARSADHPEAAAVKAFMGLVAFELLKDEVLAIRRDCKIPNELKPEYAELMAMQAFDNDEQVRAYKVKLKVLKESVNAALGAARNFDTLRGLEKSPVTAALATQLLNVGAELSMFPEEEAKRPRLASSDEEARKTRARVVGARLYRLGIDTKAAAQYLIDRGYEVTDIVLSKAIDNQRKREKGQKRLKNSSER
jgi:hypothetical protein